MSANDSLYARVGGYDALGGIVQRFFQRLAAAPSLGHFFQARPIDSKRRNWQLTVLWLVERSGGPAYYFGRDMRTSHRGMGISAAHWAEAMRLWRETLAESGVGEREAKELVALFETTRDDCVEPA